MPLTRAAIEAEIVDRIGPRMSYVGMQVSTAGSNGSLNGPIRRAFVSMGFSVAAPLVIDDGDLAHFVSAASATPAFDAWRVERLVDLACLNVLESILFKTTDVDWVAGQNQAKAHQFVDDIRADVATWTERVSKPYGPDLPAATLGSMTTVRIPNDPFDPCRSRSLPGHWPYPD